jgi:hypothetical protein
MSWLQSPTANGLFSPGGGLESALNTPTSKGAAMPRTPRTPTASTSFFFTDAANLPRDGETTPPKGDAGGKRPGSQIICISPLATNPKAGAHQVNTPLNLKDVFSSPAEKARHASIRRRNAKSDPNVDAVNMAERDVMEDEDLSVLLQLAKDTPRNGGERAAASAATATAGQNGAVFRAGEGQKTAGVPSLELPMIGKGGDGKGATLAPKTNSRDHEGNSALTMRSNSGSSYPVPMKAPSTDSKGHKSEDPRKAMGPSHLPPPYGMHPHHHFPHHGEMGYYMPHGMPPGGSMRVVVGAPPPKRPKTSGSPHTSPDRYRVPYHPYPYALPPHMQHHPHYGHYPPQARPPPNQHISHYNNAPTTKPKQVKKAKPTKPVKRPAPPPPAPKQASAPKKPKKPTSSSGASKPKKKSPQLTDSKDRQKATATIKAINSASGKHNDQAAALAAAILRGVTMRPSGKWQAQLYFAGKSRYIGVFDTREKAALAYEIAREKLKSEKANAEGSLSPKQTENAVNAARKAAFEGVNEKDPNA